MKNVLIIVILALVGAGAAYGYVRWSAAQKNPSNSSKQPAEANGHSADDGHDHGADIQAIADSSDAAGGAALCSTHRIPERIDAFCHPELVEKLGQCGEHGVPEAFCTRCNATLIVAFKAENDWCAEHNVPESQCEKCKGG